MTTPSYKIDPSKLYNYMLVKLDTTEQALALGLNASDSGGAAYYKQHTSKWVPIRHYNNNYIISFTSILIGSTEPIPAFITDQLDLKVGNEYTTTRGAQVRIIDINRDSIVRAYTYPITAEYVNKPGSTNTYKLSEACKWTPVATASALDIFHANKAPIDNAFITYIHANKLGGEILKALNKFPFDASLYNSKALSLRSLFTWNRTPQGQDFWSKHDVRGGNSASGAQLQQYLNAYLQAESGTLPDITKVFMKQQDLKPDPTRIYKVGDKVMIRPDLQSEVLYTGHNGSTCRTADGRNMTKYAGKTTTIKAICNNISKYRLAIDGGSWFWNSDMLIPMDNDTEVATIATHEKCKKQSQQLAEAELKHSIGAATAATTIPNTQSKGKTIMTKIKEVAIQAVDQNKQALAVAAKMEAGRIINKQVLKQLTPHLPFFLQGYAKSPLAPFVAANLVTVVANHTQNKKLSQVADLMLLGAADSGVASFNLDKIVDDILANIKLPTGIFDDEE